MIFLETKIDISFLHISLDLVHGAVWLAWKT